MAIQQTLTWARGEDILLNGTFPANPGSISGWTMVFEAKDPPGGASVATHFTATAVVTSAVDATYTVTISSASTVSMDPGTYAWDFWRTDTSAKRQLAYGTLKLTQSVRF
jgi:hypothetical protein